jgi:protein CpxP
MAAIHAPPKLASSPEPEPDPGPLIPQRKEIMKHSPKQLFAAMVLAGLGLAAVAQTPPGPAPGGPGRQERMERHDPARMQQFMQQRRAHRLARLKETLQITPQQEGAWAAWTASMQPPANWKRPDRAEFERLTTPERIDRMRALRTQRMARMDQRAEATKVFYSALNPIQKRVFDLETARRGHRGGREGGRGGHHGHGMN